jgi:hypothetical protein
MEEQRLLRFPLVPSHYQEEFKIGNYTVTYTDREVLVRIAPAIDDKQLRLFQGDQEFYELSDHSLNLTGLVPKFEGFWKIYSNILLKAHGFPIPESIVLLSMTPETNGALIDFAHRRNYTHVLVRHDRSPELAQPPRGGYLVALRHAAKQLVPFFKQRRILMLQEPLSPYGDLYSCNASLRKQSTSAHLEIVGPGFDASDLNRGDTTPHEVWELTCDGGAELNLSTAKQIRLVDRETYHRSVRQRLVKIGKRLIGAFDIEKKEKRRDKTEEQLVALAIRHLKRQGQMLLVDHLEHYSPLGTEQIRKFAELLRELHNYRDSRLFQWREEIIISMSLLPSGRIVCWQIVWPEKQAYGGD